MVNKIRITTNAAAPATGTYSQAIRTGDLVFVTAQTGRNPETGKLEEGLEAQTRQMLSNIDAILNAAGCSPADIVKVYAAARGHQGFQSRGCDLRRLASRSRCYSVAGPYCVRSGVASGGSAGHARSCCRLSG